MTKMIKEKEFLNFFNLEINDKFSLKLVVILFYFLPIFLITGPAIPDISITLISIWSLFQIDRENLKILKSKIFIFMFTIWLYFIFASTLSNEKIFSLKSSLPYLRFILFSFGVVLFLKYKKINFHSLLYIFYISIFIVLMSGLVEFLYYNTNFIKEIENPRYRLSGLFGDELILGSYVSRLLPILIAFFFAANINDNKKFLLLFIIFFADVICYLTGERVAFFYITLTAVLCIFLLSKYQVARIFILILSIATVYFITIYTPSVKQRVLDYTIQQLGLDEKSERIKFFSVQHERHYGSALKMFYDRPYFGVGTNNFRKSCKEQKYFYKKDSCNTHPHHTYLQLLAETGIIGFMGIFSIFLFLCFRFYKHLISKYLKKKIILSDYNICIQIALFISLFPLVPTGNFFNNWLSIIYFYPVGFIIYEYLKKNF